jgi:excisionase family DNA binding protein
VADKMIPPGYLSPAEAAQKLGCSQSTVRRLIARGRMPSTRIPGVRRVFIPVACLDALMGEHPAKPGAEAAASPALAYPAMAKPRASNAPDPRRFGKPPRRRQSKRTGAPGYIKGA